MIDTVLTATETENEVIQTVKRYGGTRAPFGYAGFVVGECTILCHECHDEDTDSTDSPIFGDSEADYPGLICENCTRTLDTRIISYENGPAPAGDNEVHE
jgi:hypothetical protein